MSTSLPYNGTARSTHFRRRVNHNGEDESVGNAEAIESVECARGNTVSPSSGDEDTRDFEDEAEQNEASDMAKAEREMRYLNKTERAASDMGKAERVEGDFDETKRVPNDLCDITSTFESQLLSLKHEATTARQRQHRWRVIGIALVFIALWLVRLRFRGLPEDVPESLDHLVTWPQRQRRVVDAFEHAWKGYRRFGWGSDQVNVVTGTSNEWMYCGLTIVDSLDTAAIMGLRDIVTSGRHFIGSKLRFDANVDANVFELTIRVLGGLLSMYDLERDRVDGHAHVYLHRARELGDMLLTAFNSSWSGVPLSSYNFALRKAIGSRNGASTAEATSLQLEFRYLSYLTNDLRFWRAAEKAMKVVLTPSHRRIAGIVPIFLSVNTGRFRGYNYRIGSRGDSYYEYLAKQFLQTGSTEPVFHDMFEEALDGIMKHLVDHSAPNGLLFVGEWQDGPEDGLTAKMDHLVCFLPGTVMLHVTKGQPLHNVAAPLSPKHRAYIAFAEQLTHTCYEMYRRMPSGNAPEIVYFNVVDKRGKDIIVLPADGFSLLRPETIESLFYMHRLTRNETYREWAWNIFKSFERHARVKGGGYASLENVQTATPEPSKTRPMESFFLAETLKYLYLIFAESADRDDELLPLDNVVFNTEAHPLRVMDLRGGVEFRTKLKYAGLGLFDDERTKGEGALI